MNRLTERQHIILGSLIDAHIECASPIGSEVLTRRFHVGFSSATIRNEMGSLEEMGFLEHPHTSAGRIPTDAGYRYYVDHCVENNEVSKLKKIEWERAVETVTTSTSSESAAEVLSRLAANLSDETGIFVLESISRSKDKNHSKLLVQGTANFLDKPEFQDAKKLKKLFEALEEKHQIAAWISHAAKEPDSTVKIGKENEPTVLWDCTVIAAGCGKNGQMNSAIAIMGPRRMRYDLALPLIRLIADMAGEILSRRSDEYYEK